MESSSNLNNFLTNPFHPFASFSFSSAYAYYSDAAFSTSWYVGIFLSVLGSFAGALGDNLVRLSYLHENTKFNMNPRYIWERPLWLAGEFLVIFVNPCLSIISLKVAAASIVLPFAGLHIFWNVVLASNLLREKILKFEIFGSIVILIGIVLVVSFGVHKVPLYSLDKILSLLESSIFLTYSFIIFIICGICCFNAYRTIHLKYENIRSNACIGIASGLFGGVGNLLAKSVIEILNSHSIFSIFFHFRFCVLIFCLCLCCLFQLIFLNLALYKHEAKHVVPIVNASLVSCGSIGGVLLFEEYLHMSYFNFYMFLLGVFTVVSGLLILIKAGKANPNPLSCAKSNVFQNYDESFDEKICLTSDLKNLGSSDFRYSPQRLKD